MLAIISTRLLHNVRSVFALCHSKQLLPMLSAQLISGQNTMKIERLSFLISPPHKIQDFVDADKQMWDPWLRMRTGFIQKTATTHPGGRVEIQIFWSSKADQDKAAIHPELPIIEATFRNVVGPIYHLLYAD